MTQINKPNWRDAPKWANWTAQDYDGTWDWYSHKPVLTANMWDIEDFEHEVDLARMSKGVNDDWRETLEARP